MRSSHCLFLLFGLTILLADLSFAQTSTFPETRRIPQGSASQFVGTFHVGRKQWGSLTTGNSKFGPDVCYSNTMRSSYYSAVGGPGWCYLDKGALPDRGESEKEQINGVEFEYCSTYPDATGNAGTIVLYFFDDLTATACEGPLGGASSWVHRIQVNNLPLGGANGELQCWRVILDLTGGAEFNLLQEESGQEDRRFGWTMECMQPDAGPVLAKDGYQNLCDSFHFKVPGGSQFQCFWTDNCFPPRSFYLRLSCSVRDAENYYPSQPGPKDRLWLFTGTAVPGSGLTLVVDQANPLLFYWWAASLASANESIAGGTVLAKRPWIQPAPMFMPNGELRVQLPLQMPRHLYTQALESLALIPTAGCIGEMSQGIRYQC